MSEVPGPGRRQFLMSEIPHVGPYGGVSKMDLNSKEIRFYNPRFLPQAIRRHTGVPRS